MGRAAAAAAALVCLYAPPFFWLAPQDLAEPLSAALVALALFLVVRWPRDLRAYAGAAAAIAVAAANRVWTLPFLVLLPLGLVILDTERPWSRRLGRGLVAVAAGLVVYVPLSRLLPSYGPAFDLMTLVNVSTLSNNMTPFMRTALPASLDPVFLARGLWHNLRGALFSQSTLSATPFSMTRWLPAADVWPANVAAALSLSGVFARGTDRLRRWVMLLGFLAFGMHVGIAVLLQNTPRYLGPLLPAIVLGAAVAVARWVEVAGDRRWVRAVAVAGVALTLAGFLAVDVRNAYELRTGAIRAEAQRRAAEALVARSIPRGARVVVDTAWDPHWAADWAAYPRPTLVLGTDFAFTGQQYGRLLAAFKGDYLLTGPASTLPSVTGADRVAEGAGYVVWRLPAASR
jgi:hypothetical protein